jgi:hypothetical protein
MATRIYTKVSGAVGVTPSTWNFANQINPVTVPGTLAKNDGSAMTSKTEATGIATIAQAMGRTIIGPLAAQSIAGSISGQMRAMQNNNGASGTLAMAVKIVQPGGADRAVLLAQTASDAATSAPHEFVTNTLTNRQFADVAEATAITLTTQSATAGDYLVIEWGFRSATAVDRTVTLSYGNDNATDLTAGDSGETTARNPWWEFSQTLIFLATTAGAGSAQATAARIASSLRAGSGAAQASRIGTANATRAGSGQQQATAALQAALQPTGLTLRVPGVAHRQGTANLLVRFVDNASPREAIEAGRVTMDATSFDVTATFRQGQSGRILLSSAMPQYSGSFSDIVWSIPGTTHNLGTTALLWEVWDAASPPRRLEPGSVTVAPGSFNVTLTFAQSQSGTVILAAPSARYTETFGSFATWSIPGTTHNLGTADLFWQVYDAAGTPAALRPGRVTIDPTSFNVEITFRQAQAGTIVLAAPPTRYAAAFTVQDGQVTLLTTVEQRALFTPAGIKSVTVSEQASSIRLASSLRAGSGTAQASAAHVASSQRIGSGQAQATTTRLTSSLRAATALAQATTARVASSVRSGSGQAQASTVRLASEVRVSTVQEQATRSAVSSSLRAGAAQVQVTTIRVASELRASTVQEQAMSSRVASSLRSGSGHIAGSGVPSGNLVQAGTGIEHASSTQVASSLRIGIGQAQAQTTRLASSVRAGSGRLAGHATLIAGFPTSLAVTIMVPGTTHGVGSGNLFVEATDTASPLRVLEPASITIHPTTFDVIVRETQGENTRVIIHLIPAPYVLPFTGQGSLNIPGGTHGLGSADLAWQLLDAGTPAQVVEPGSLTVRTDNAAVDLVFRQNQSGTLILSRGLPAFVHAFTSTMEVVLDGSTHGLATAALRVHVYDDVTPVRAALTPGSVTIHPTTFQVKITFTQLQAGVVVLSAATPVSITLPVATSAAQQTGTGRVQATSQRVASAVRSSTAGLSAHARLVAIQPTTLATTVLVPGTTHQFGTGNILVQAYDTVGTALTVEPGTITIHPTSFDVAIAFYFPPAGIILLRQAPAPYTQGFAAPSFTVNGTTHNLGTANLFVQLRDAATPAALLAAASVTVTTASKNVDVTFDQSQSGTILVSVGTPVYVHPFTGETQFTIAGTLHNLLTPDLVWQIWDAGSPAIALIEPASVTIDTGNKDVTVRFDQLQSGTVLLSAALPVYRIAITSPGAAAVEVSGSMAGPAAPRVTTNLRTGSGHQQGQAGPIASAILAKTGFMGASAGKIASSLRAGAAHLQASSVGVGSAIRASSAQEQASSVRLASSLRAGSATIHDTMTRVASASRLSTGQEQSSATRLASSLRAGTAMVHATGTPLPAGTLAVAGQVTASTSRIASSLRAGSGVVYDTTAHIGSAITGRVATITAQTARLASSLRAGSGTAHAQATRMASEIRAATGMIQVNAIRVASSLRTASGMLHGVGVGLTPGVVSVTVHASGVAVRIASSLRAAAAHEQASSARIGHAVAFRAVQVQALASRVASSLRTGLGLLQGTSTRVASSVRTGSGIFHAQMTRLASEVLARTPVVHAVAGALTSSLRVGSGQIRSVPSQAGGAVGSAHLAGQMTRVASSVLARPEVIHAFTLELASSLRASGAMLHGASSHVSSSLLARPASIQGLASRSVNQILTRPALIQALASSLLSQIHAATGQAQGTSSTLRISQILARLVQIQGQNFTLPGLQATGHMEASAQRLANSVLSHPAVIQAVTAEVVSALAQRGGTLRSLPQVVAHEILARLLQEQALAVALISEVRPSQGQSGSTVTLLASSLLGSTGSWSATASLIGIPRRHLHGRLRTARSQPGIAQKRQVTSVGG